MSPSRAKSENVTPVTSRGVQRYERERDQSHRAAVFWLTGLSGSGKSTIALAAERMLFRTGKRVVLLDGDNVRTGLCGDLGFSLEDRRENVRRVAEVARLYLESGHIVLCSFVSPTAEIRAFAKTIVGAEDFHEVYVSADIATCEARDVKGLYAKARAGEIRGFTGIDSPYEAPESPDVELATGEATLEDCIAEFLRYVRASTTD